MTHDRYCPITTTALLDCPICALLKAARDDERRTYQETWRANLPRVEARNWMDGYRAAVNGRPVPEWVTRGSVPMRRG